jgi:hypothetical protein
MAKPSINPKLFEGQKICSLKHDDYLILLKKDSDYLKNILKQFFKGRINKELSKDIIVWTNENQTSSCALKSYLETDEGKSVKDYSEKKALYIEIPYKSIEIKSWNPERTIKNNGYYIGSIDLSVVAEVSYTTGLLIDEERSWIWDYFNRGKTIERKEFIFEFKPKINSYSEVIRQIKVYSSYLERDVIPICITESDTSKFKEIFESQGIYIFNINELEDKQNEGVKDDGGF